MNLYRLTIWETEIYKRIRVLHKWFLTEEEMRSYKDKYEKEHRWKDGKCIPNIPDISFYTNISYHEDKMTFEEAKESDTFTLKDFVTLFHVNVDVVETDWYFDENGEIRCSYCDEKSYIQDQLLRRECYCSICGHKMSNIILQEKTITK